MTSWALNENQNMWLKEHNITQIFHIFLLNVKMVFPVISNNQWSVLQNSKLSFEGEHFLHLTKAA